MHAGKHAMLSAWGLTDTISLALMRRFETSTCQQSASLSRQTSRILRRCALRERKTLVTISFFFRRMSSLGHRARVPHQTCALADHLLWLAAYAAALMQARDAAGMCEASSAYRTTSSACGPHA